MQGLWTQRDLLPAVYSWLRGRMDAHSRKNRHDWAAAAAGVWTNCFLSDRLRAGCGSCMRAIYERLFAVISGALRWAGLTWNRPVNWLQDISLCLCVCVWRLHSVYERMCLALNERVNLLYGVCLWHRRQSRHTGGSDTSVLALGFPGPLSGGTQSA